MKLREVIYPIEFKQCLMVKMVKEVQKNLDNLPNRVQAMFDGEDGQRSPEKFGQTE